MSVIPLIIEGPEPTVVERQQDFKVEGKAVRIGNLDLEQLTNKDRSNVSYDFRVGNRYRSHLEKHPVEISDGGTITLRPGSALIIETEEYVHLPRCMFGIIAPRVSLLQRGLSTTFSKVDPGYHGHLLITLFNLGQSTENLKKGQTFCAFTLFDVKAGAELYNEDGKRLDVRSGHAWKDRIREWLEANHILVTILLIVATLYLATVHLIAIIRGD